MKNIAIIDIDGVLADYRLGLLYWIRQSYPRFSHRANEYINSPNVWINNETMKVSYKEWLDCLEMFRMSGGKQSIPLMKGAKELIQMCLSKNLEIVLVTSRPMDLYSNIYRDTVEWLRNANIIYHLLLWSKEKSVLLHRMRLIEKTLFVVDDELGHIKDYAKLGLKCYWLDHYNKTNDLIDPNVCVVEDLFKIIDKEILNYEQTDDTPTLHY